MQATRWMVTHRSDCPKPVPHDNWDKDTIVEVGIWGRAAGNVANIWDDIDRAKDMRWMIVKRDVGWWDRGHCRRKTDASWGVGDE